MALSTATTWEVRTTGNDLNGGGFVTGASGTDYSQFNSAQFNGTDLAATSATGTAPVVTSASHNFVTADVGNIIHISAGTSWTTGWYQIVSVASNAATLDRACGSIASPVSGTWYEGGALATVKQVIINMTVTGMTAYIKSGTSYSVTSTMTLSSASNALTFIGYTTTRGDGGQATLTTATNSVNLITYSSGTSTMVFENIIFSCTAGTPGNGFTNTNAGYLINLHFFNCKFTGWNLGFSNPSGSSITIFMYMENCNITSCSYGLSFAGGSTTLILIDTIVQACTNDGIAQSGSGLSLFAIRSTFYNNGGKGVNQSVSAACSFSLFNCNFASNTSDGLTYGGSSTSLNWLVVSNTIFYSNGGYGINVNTSVPILDNNLLNCFFYNNSSGKYTTAVTQSVGEIAGGANPFNNASGGDFSLNQAATGGALCRGAGWPGILQAGGTGYEDVGAISHGDPKWRVGFRGV